MKTLSYTTQLNKLYHDGAVASTPEGPHYVWSDGESAETVGHGPYLSETALLIDAGNDVIETRTAPKHLPRPVPGQRWVSGPIVAKGV